jgi:hypothetical protein
MLPQNVGTIDRWIRIVLGLLLIVAGLFVLGGTGGTILGIVGFIPLLTGLSGRCLLYLPFRIGTK